MWQESAPFSWCKFSRSNSHRLTVPSSAKRKSHYTQSRSNLDFDVYYVFIFTTLPFTNPVVSESIFSARMMQQTSPCYTVHKIETIFFLQLPRSESLSMRPWPMLEKNLQFFCWTQGVLKIDMVYRSGSHLIRKQTSLFHNLQQLTRNRNETERCTTYVGTKFPKKIWVNWFTDRAATRIAASALFSTTECQLMPRRSRL